MSGRYIVDGLLADARTGKRVGFASRMVVTSGVFAQAAERATDASRIVRANGCQRIEFTNGGRIVFLSSDKNAGRGQTFDVLAIDESELSMDAMTSAAVCVLPHGELILV